MATIPSDSALRRISHLARVYASNNGNYLKHGPNDWRKRWGTVIPAHWEFPSPLTRGYLLDKVKGLTSERSIETAEKVFLAIMVWGFGNTGYGPHRVSEMRKSREDGLGQYMLDIVNAADGGPVGAYRHMAKNSATQLGPTYASKVAYFVTAGEISPILDSEVALWVTSHQGKWLFRSNKWSTTQYEDYQSYCHDLLNEIVAVVPEGHRTLGLVEYLMFIDQAASSLPKWAKTI